MEIAFIRKPRSFADTQQRCRSFGSHLFSLATPGAAGGNAVNSESAECACFKNPDFGMNFHYPTNPRQADWALQVILAV
ncbi:MAG: hypothetical protein ACREFU_07120 [Acetobacteraceae bacterium]